ncbi:hypothetical protein HX773_24445 [Pantoea sp. B9002]|uniref:hypothetical protein n=1 Tax=Pantoea sp. B9002 TaxID=2726979 RepID=UPI00159F8049|nr:hypothetical protein [Pantoea sp. B9002]NWA64051.1 hypothetical protein [Pantoea sp. B9002]
MNKITFRDAYPVVHWDSDYFPDAKNRKIISGKNVAKKLFHLQRFAQGRVNENELVKMLAVRLNGRIDDELKVTRALLTSSIKRIKTEARLNSLPGLELDTQSEGFKTYEVTIESPVNPRIASFIRLFAQLDEISVQLKTQYISGMITKDEYKRIERDAAKPLRKLILDVHTMLKNFFQLEQVKNNKSAA